MTAALDSPIIRRADPSDVPAITAIYRHYVLTHTCTFEIDPPDEAAMAARMRRVLERDLPYCVAERDGRVVGYAYAGPYHARAGYRYTLEDSIYIAPAEAGRGLGGRLLEPVLRACRERGYREVVAVIGDSANEPSIRLHRGFGFQPVGTLRNVGRKFDRWLDTVILQFTLESAGEP